MLSALRSFTPNRRAIMDPLIAVVGATGTGKSKVIRASHPATLTLGS
jgi:DNA repair exonuclease SbcCD ATPase subunit